MCVCVQVCVTRIWLVGRLCSRVCVNVSTPACYSGVAGVGVHPSSCGPRLPELRGGSVQAGSPGGCGLEGGHLPLVPCTRGAAPPRAAAGGTDGLVSAPGSSAWPPACVSGLRPTVGGVGRGRSRSTSLSSVVALPLWFTGPPRPQASLGRGPWARQLRPEEPDALPSPAGPGGPGSGEAQPSRGPRGGSVCPGPGPAGCPSGGF